MSASTLMIQGTTSDAGKSTLATALCRCLYREGIKVAPFKPQNMALNSAVTNDGGEIGRAQAVQAQACGLVPHTDMNPVLLKPNSDIAAQVIINGKPLENMDAWSYHQYKPIAKQAVFDAHRRLASNYDAVIVEGAGSPAEINLREGDIANMGFAEAADCPVILIGDIDRGGVFASLVGTLALLNDSERERVRGVVINRFRGDISLLEPGLEWFEGYTKKPVLGVLPWISNLHVEAEDSIPRDRRPETGSELFRIVVPALPRISNHTDFDPLRLHPEMDCRFIGPGETIPAADLIIIPGSKSVCADLNWLKDSGWQSAIMRHLRYGGKLIGICGGYQMLGRWVKDPNGIEGKPGEVAGLGLLDMVTVITPHKRLQNVTGNITWNRCPVSGYEIHAGVTTGPALSKPLFQLGDRYDGAISEDGLVIGGYLHGIFELDGAQNSFLSWAGFTTNTVTNYREKREREIDRLANIVENHLDMQAIRSLLTCTS